ncbi:MAG: hypothetical protein BWY59_00529 [Verrucomicrobia bacterium ADurb.Bin345]|nr:MAG: hypothetical protein BWY59_00529 [Verrucomicrobia bacterium ADurb.Bin345]
MRCYVAPHPVPLRNVCAAVRPHFEALVATRIHFRPEHSAVRDADFVAVFPRVRPVNVAVGQRARRVGVEADVYRRPIPRNIFVRALRHFVAADVGRINAEQRFHLVQEIGHREAVRILHARQVRRSQHVNARGDHNRAQELQHALAAGARHLALDTHVARQDDHAVVRVTAGRKLVEIHEIRLIPETLQRARKLLHFAFVAVVLGIVRVGPEERDVGFRVRGPAEPVGNADLAHEREHVARGPVGRLDDAVGIDNAEALFAIGDKRAILPREDVRADRAHLQALPQRIADKRSLAKLGQARPHRFRAGEPGLRIEHGDLGHLLRIGDSPMALLRLVAEDGPGVVVHAEEVYGRADILRGRGDLPAVLRVVTPVLLAPLHADR